MIKDRGMAGSYGCDVGGVSLYADRRREQSPYLDFATRAIPRTFSDVIDWSEHVATLNDDLWTGLKNLYTYFSSAIDINSFDLRDGEYEDTNTIRWDVMLHQKLGYGGHENQVGLNTAVYGNDFVTVTLKHTRLLVCPRCSTQVMLKEVDRHPGMDFKFKNMNFTGFCPHKKCKGMGRVQFKVEHIYSRDVSNVIIKHWPIRELDFDYSEATDKLQVYWRIPARVKKRVLQDQDIDTLHDLDLGVLRAICENRLLAFDDRVMFHAREPHLSGLENRGLGIPRTLALSRQHWLVQLLKKQCQALASEYVTPMGFFSMDGGGGSFGSMDIVQRADAAMFANNIEAMITEHRHDPRRKYVVPFPVKFQYAGGGADQFVPVGLMQHAEQSLAHSLIPYPMLRGEITAQAAPMFLRTFEAMHREIPELYNRFLWFVVGRVAELLQLSPISAIHQSPSTADNVMLDSMLMQAAMSGQAANYSWMRRVGLNPRTERNRQLSEARLQLDFQRKMEELQRQYGTADMVSQNAQAVMQAALQGQPEGQMSQEEMAMQPGQTLLPSQGFSPATDLLGMEAQSAALAAQLAEMPPELRKQELAILRQGHQAMHHMVTGELNKIRQQTAYAARKEVAPNL